MDTIKWYKEMHLVSGLRLMVSLYSSTILPPRDASVPFVLLQPATIKTDRSGCDETSAYRPAKPVN